MAVWHTGLAHVTFRVRFGTRAALGNWQIQGGAVGNFMPGYGIPAESMKVTRFTVTR